MMGSFNNKIAAEYNPPRKWVLTRALSYKNEEIDSETLEKVGVKIKSDRVSVSKGFVTDLASVPRICWMFIAPFDVARAAVVHDILYEKINTQYKTVNESMAAEDGPATKKEREVYREIADHVFLEGMNASEPSVASWKKYAAYYAVRAFGRWVINSSAKRVA